MLWWLVQNTVGATILAGLVALICVLGRPRPALRHALWLVVLIKLLTPPLVSWPWTPQEVGHSVYEWLAPQHVADLLESPPPAPSDVQPVPDGFQVIFIPVDPQEESLLTIPETDSIAALSSAPKHSVEDMKIVEKPEIGGSKFELPILGFGISDIDQGFDFMKQLWFAGALGVGLWQIGRLWRFHRRLCRGQPPPQWLAREVAGLAVLLHIRMPRVLVLAETASPLVWGLGSARLIWPEELSKRLSEYSRRSVLLHELAHLRRRDHWVAWLQLVGSCLYWWNPLFWFVSRQVRENAELACDAWVVTTLPETRRAFAEALIEVAQMMSTKGAPAPALGLGAERRRDFERRLLMIMCAGVPCKLSLRGLVVVGLLALTALPGWSIGQQETEKPKAPAAPVTLPPPPTPQELVPAPAPPAPPVAEAPPAFVAAPYSAFAGFSGPGQSDSDARLKAIEDQLQALLKEVRGMRKGGATKASTPAAPSYGPYAPPTITAVPPTAGQVAFPPPPSRSDGAITLTRAIYDLPAAKAKALSDLLQDSKGPTVEIKAEGDKVTVTCTPEAQQIIGQLIAMLQGKARVRFPRTTYQYHAVPVTTYETETVPATPSP